MNPKENLKKLNLELPQVSTAGGNYESVNIRQNICLLYTSPSPRDS